MPGHGGQDGAELLDDVRRFVARFVAFPSRAALNAVTLWTAHAHTVDASDSSPRLALLSPEPGSGKTRTLEVLELLVPRPMHALNAAVAPIFRSIQAERPTLLFDEVDAIFGRHGKDDPAEDLRGLLNAGHRKGASVPRCVGKDFKVERFPVYAAAALAGLGDLPDTLMSRSIIVRMRRRAPGEHVEPFRRRVHSPAGEELRARLVEWAESVSSEIEGAWPELPDGIVDRSADVWEPLLAIAESAGRHWPETARAACVELAAVAAGRDASLGIRLLADIRIVLTKAKADRMPTDLLLDKLHALDEAPWSDLRGKPLDARGLARRVGQYEVKPHQFKVEEVKVRGYSIPGSEEHGGGLYDAFERYLPPLSHSSGTDGTAGTAQLSGVDPVPDAGARTGTGPRSGTEREPATWAVPAVPQVPHIQKGTAGGPEIGPCACCSNNPTRRYGDNAEPLCQTCRPIHPTAPRKETR